MPPKISVKSKFNRTNQVHDAHAWAVSYVDMLTLLLCFFIIFFNADKSKLSSIRKIQAKIFDGKSSGSGSGTTANAGKGAGTGNGAAGAGVGSGNAGAGNGSAGTIAGAGTGLGAGAGVGNGGEVIATPKIKAIVQRVEQLKNFYSKKVRN